MQARLFLTLLFILVLAASAMPATYFTGNLTSGQEVPPNPSTATGFGRVTLNAAETQITATFYWAGLTGNATAGHIHGPAAAGVNGPVIFNMAPAASTSGSVVAMPFAVTPSQVADLKAGLWYFNIHTAANPGGEIRGQILLDAPFISFMDNDQEVPATASTAGGSGAISLNPATNQAMVTMNWSGLSGNAVAGHVHSARSGVNGPVICDLAPTAAPSGSVVDKLCTFSAAQVTALKTAQLYLNIHTAASPGGEIRGQIQRRTSTVCDFDGDSITDASIARNNAGIEWWIRNSSNGSVAAFPFGSASDYVQSRIVCGDYDGDGKDDVAYWRSAATPNAFFFILESSTFTVRQEQFGTTGDDPRVVEDYDGDGRADIAVYRSGTNAMWFFKGSANNAAGNTTYVTWGGTGDFANPGDFDGDGRGDFLVQDGGNWWLLRSSDLGFSVTPFGTASMFGTPGDYDGDGKTDIAGTLTETPNLAWYYIPSSNPASSPYTTRRAWGPSGGTRTRAQGDYDGDGKSDYAVWIEGATSPETGFWALPSSGASHIFIPWGMFSSGTNDFPIPGYNNR
jgi:hypothetical protein